MLINWFQNRHKFRYFQLWHICLSLIRVWKMYDEIINKVKDPSTPSTCYPHYPLGIGCPKKKNRFVLRYIYKLIVLMRRKMVPLLVLCFPNISIFCSLSLSIWLLFFLFLPKKKKTSLFPLSLSPKVTNP